MAGTGTGERTRTRTSTEMSTRVAMGTRTRVETGTRIEMKVDRRESLETFEVVKEADQKTRERGATPTSNQQLQPQDPTPRHKTRRPSETVASRGGPEPRYGR